MIALTPARALAVLLCVAYASLIGCASTPPSKFYVLSSLQKQAPAKEALLFLATPVVAVGPIDMPDYLNRPQIVVRTSQNELFLSEFDRWAGSFKADVGRVVAEDVAVILGSQATVVVWTPIIHNSVPIETNVYIDIQRFEGTPGKGVMLQARWGITGKQWKDVSVVREGDYREPITGNNYDALVAAMSRTLEQLSRDIAAGIKPYLNADRAGKN